MVKVSMSDDYRNVVISDEKNRLVSGFANVAVLDRQGDIVPTDAMAKAMMEYMRRGGIVLLGHANKPVGKVVQWSIQKPEGSDADGIHIIAAIDTGTEPADEAWKKLGNKTITGFSIGGSAKDQEQVRDKAAVGGMARELKGVELHEISLVEIPANQLATVSDISVAKSCDNGGCKMEKELHRGPFDTKELADQAAQKLKQEGKVVYGVAPRGDGTWEVNFGWAKNPANDEAPREEMHPKTKQPVLMALKTLEGVKAMGLDWEPTREDAEKVALEMKAEGFIVHEIVPDGNEWRIDYGRDENPAEKAEGAPEGPTVKEQDPNFDQTKYGVQSMGKDDINCSFCGGHLGAIEHQDHPNPDWAEYRTCMDCGHQWAKKYWPMLRVMQQKGIEPLQKGGNETVRRKVGIEIAGVRVRAVGADGTRGQWHHMTDSEKEQNRLYGAGELAAATNIPSGFQPAQPIPKKEAVSTGEAGVQNARYSPEQEEKVVRGEDEPERGMDSCPHCGFEQSPEVVAAHVRNKHPEKKAVDDDGVEVEKPFQSVAQQRYMHAKHPEIARRWDKITDFSSLPEHKKDLVEEDIGKPEESQPVVGEEAFTEHTEGPQGDKYGEFGEKAVDKPLGRAVPDNTCVSCGKNSKTVDGFLCPRCYREMREQTTGKGVDKAVDKPLGRAVPDNTCVSCGKNSKTVDGFLCPRCYREMREQTTGKGVDKAVDKPLGRAVPDNTCVSCGKNSKTVDGFLCPRCYREMREQTTGKGVDKAVDKPLGRAVPDNTCVSCGKNSKTVDGFLCPRCYREMREQTTGKGVDKAVDKPLGRAVPDNTCVSCGKNSKTVDGFLCPRCYREMREQTTGKGVDKAVDKPLGRAVPDNTCVSCGKNSKTVDGFLCPRCYREMREQTTGKGVDKAVDKPLGRAVPDNTCVSCGKNSKTVDGFLCPRCYREMREQTTGKGVDKADWQKCPECGNVICRGPVPGANFPFVEYDAATKKYRPICGGGHLKSVEKLNPVDQEAGKGKCTYCRRTAKVHEDSSGRQICEDCESQMPAKSICSRTRAAVRAIRKVSRLRQGSRC